MPNMKDILSPSDPDAFDGNLITSLNTFRCGLTGPEIVSEDPNNDFADFEEFEWQFNPEKDSALHYDV